MGRTDPRRRKRRAERSITPADVGEARPTSRRSWRAPLLGFVLVVLAGVIAAQALTPIERDTVPPARTEASAAVKALRDGDQVALDARLAANVGDPDFAYFFASELGPRGLGEALAAMPVVEDSDDGFRAIELTLTDLAGAVALATHGTGDRALGTEWTGEFIEATTIGSSDGELERASPELHDLRVHEHLLLLLSRGYWSTDFLRRVTKAYWELDHRQGEEAWPTVDASDRDHAAAVNGAVLTDGILALTAALTANPAASEWAFTAFQPGTVEIEGSDHALGKFTHYLLFEHEFPQSADGESVGITASLTALSSAVEFSEATESTAAGKPPGPDGTPKQDAATLQALAEEVADESGCSWDPRDYLKCIGDLAKTVWGWVQRWGHVVLDVATQFTFILPPFGTAVGSAAAMTNAIWYGIEGDYVNAGLSLAAAVPGLAYTKLTKHAVAASRDAKAAAQVKKVGTTSTRIADKARAWRAKPWKSCAAPSPGGIQVKYPPTWTKQQIRDADDKMEAYWRAAQENKLRRTTPQRSGTAPSRRYKDAGLTVPEGADVDHVIDLQLGGSDDLVNMKPLDRAVNRSLGIQIAQQLKPLPVGHLINSISVC